MLAKPFAVVATFGMTRTSVFALHHITNRELEIARFNTVEEAAQFTDDVWGASWEK